MVSLGLAALRCASLSSLSWAAAIAARKHAPSTKRSFAIYVRAFKSWSKSLGLSTAQIQRDSRGLCLLAFLSHYAREGLRGRPVSPRTVSAASTAIRAHFGRPEWATSRTYLDFMRGLRRTQSKPVVKKRPFRARWLRRWFEIAASRGLAGSPDFQRDFALLVVGFYGALRRSELAALNVGDICFKSQRQLGGVYFNMARLRIRRSKTDQAGAGQEVLLFEASPASCPLRALRSVLHLRPPDRMEPLFVKPSGKRISEGYVNRLVKRVISMVAPGHDPARYGAHSLRRGGLTALACAGVLPALVQRHARHKDPRSTLGYMAPPLGPLASAFGAI